MISSPCKKCHKRDFPKDECLKSCEILQGVQDLQLAKIECSGYTAIDYGEDSRFSIILPLTGTNNAY